MKTAAKAADARTDNNVNDFRRRRQLVVVLPALLHDSVFPPTEVTHNHTTSLVTRHTAEPYATETTRLPVREMLDILQGLAADGLPGYGRHVIKALHEI